MPATFKFNTAYGRHDRVKFTTDPISLTHQSEAPACDINNIMKKYEKTGILEHRNTFEGKYGDFTDAPMDYHESMNSVLAAQQMFSSLPSKIRSRFGNDPGAFVDFVGNPENIEELQKMGLAKAPEPVSEPAPDLIEPHKVKKTNEAPEPLPKAEKPPIKAED